MSQNLINLTVDGDAQSRIAAALDLLEAELGALVALTPAERRELVKMGEKSESFVRQSVVVLSDNPGVLPRNFDVDGFRGDLTAVDALRPLASRLTRLHERLDDTLMALGSDLMVNALEGYAALKISGKSAGLDTLRQGLATRFANGRRAAAAPTSEATPPATP
jgi:hypothetical protein